MHGMSLQSTRTTEGLKAANFRRRPGFYLPRFVALTGAFFAAFFAAGLVVFFAAAMISPFQTCTAFLNDRGFGRNAQEMF